MTETVMGSFIWSRLCSSARGAFGLRPPGRPPSGACGRRDVAPLFKDVAHGTPPRARGGRTASLILLEGRGATKRAALVVVPAAQNRIWRAEFLTRVFARGPGGLPSHPPVVVPTQLATRVLYAIRYA